MENNISKKIGQLKNFNYFNIDLDSEIAKSTQLEATQMIFKKQDSMISSTNIPM